MMINYNRKEFDRIIDGYVQLNRNDRFETLLRSVTRCSKCAKKHPDRNDHPVNILARSLSLQSCSTEDEKASIFKRLVQDTNELQKFCTAQEETFTSQKRPKRARISIGLNPWLDFCSLHRSSGKTGLMIIGGEPRPFKEFVTKPQQRHFPLESPRSRSAIWEPIWRSFWTNLLNPPYVLSRITEFIGKHGVYFTWSQCCSSGADNNRSRFNAYIETCRPFIEKQLSLLKPRCIITFGDTAAKNCAVILSGKNPDSEQIVSIANARSPLNAYRSMNSKGKKALLQLRLGKGKTGFIPFYQPGTTASDAKNDYSFMRSFLGIKAAS